MPRTACSPRPPHNTTGTPPHGHTYVCNAHARTPRLLTSVGFPARSSTSAPTCSPSPEFTHPLMSKGQHTANIQRAALGLCVGWLSALSFEVRVRGVSVQGSGSRDQGSGTRVQGPDFSALSP
eukprot:1652888-Rhodomonas_salina.1